MLVCFICELPLSPDANVTQWRDINVHLSCAKTLGSHQMEFIDTILADVKREFLRANKKFGAFHSGHEGYAIIKEEVDELWEEVKKKEPDPFKLREESIQISAMGIRFVFDLLKQYGNNPPLQTFFGEKQDNQ